MNCNSGHFAFSTFYKDGLSDEQKKCYEDNGFILMKKLIPDENMDKIHKRFIEVSQGKTENVGEVLKYSESALKGNATGEFAINKIQNFMHDPTFFENFIAHENILAILKSLIGPNVTAVNSMLINKPPGVAYAFARHPLHQDMHYFTFRPAEKIVGTWTAMEEVNEENGCLFVVPGSHKSQLCRHEYPKKAVGKQLYHEIVGMNHLPRMNLYMEKGDTLFFNPLLFHGSGPNLSTGFRKAISVHYADSNCYFVNIKGTVQEVIEQEGFRTFSKKNGVKPEGFGRNFFKSRARMVCGNPGTFQNLNSSL